MDLSKSVRDIRRDLQIERGDPVVLIERLLRKYDEKRKAFLAEGNYEAAQLAREAADDIRKFRVE